MRSTMPLRFSVRTGGFPSTWRWAPRRKRNGRQGRPTRPGSTTGSSSTRCSGSPRQELAAALENGRRHRRWTRVARQPGPFTTHTDYRYEHRYAKVVETYDVRSDGVEQTFTIADRPAGSGDLVVRGRRHIPMPNGCTLSVNPSSGRDVFGPRARAFGKSRYESEPFRILPDPDRDVDDCHVSVPRSMEKDPRPVVD